MKTLYLLRHGDSDPAPAGGSDHARPLSEKGLRQIPKVADFMKVQDFMPEIILTSDALRAAETAEKLAELLYFTGTVSLENSLYLSTRGIMLESILSTSNDADSLMIVGHNPGIGELAMMLSGDAAGNLPAFSAGMLAVFETDVSSWEDIIDETHLKTFYAP